MSGSTREPREAWSEVGRRFEELGRALREHYAGVAESPDSATWTAAGAEEERSGDAGDRAAIRDALQRLGQAAQRLGDQTGEAVRDPAVRETAQQAARTLGDALEATFGQLGEQLRGRVGSRGSDQAEPEPTSPRPAAPPEITGEDGPPAAGGERPPGAG